MTSWRGLTPRSWDRVEPATAHPRPRRPTRRVVGHEDVVQLHLVELGLAGRLDQRVDLDPVGVHVDDEEGEALLALGGGRVAAGQADAPVGELGVGGPDLAAGDPVAAVDRHGPVVSEARSLPASGSLKSWHHSSSAERMRGRQRAFCSSVPWASRVGPTRLTPIRPTSSGARARASSSITTKFSSGPRPRPPYSVGQVTPTQRSAARSACQRRPKATSSARSSKRGGRPSPYSQGRCSLQPGPELRAEALLFRRGAQVHAAPA